MNGVFDSSRLLYFTEELPVYRLTICIIYILTHYYLQIMTRINFFISTVSSTSQFFLHRLLSITLITMLYPLCSVQIILVFFYINWINPLYVRSIQFSFIISCLPWIWGQVKDCSDLTVHSLITNLLKYPDFVPFCWQYLLENNSRVI